MPDEPTLAMLRGASAVTLHDRYVLVARSGYGRNGLAFFYYASLSAAALIAVLAFVSENTGPFYRVETDSL